MENPKNSKPLALLTNDDGLDSVFLHHLAKAVSQTFEVIIAAPATEKSWIGHAMSRRSDVTVKVETRLPWPAWKVDGTPADCVNIALGHLLDRKPAVVISGINIGFNTTYPLIYSSGTIAAAMEGAFWEIPAIASSQAIPSHLFEKVSHSRGNGDEELETLLQKAAEHTAQFAQDLLNRSEPAYGIVHNLNFPSNWSEETEQVQTEPAHLDALHLYSETEEKGTYTFRYSDGREKAVKSLTDREAIAKGKISYSRLDFASVCSNPRD